MSQSSSKVSSPVRTSTGAAWLFLPLALLALLTHIGIGSFEWYAPWDVVKEILRGPVDDTVINRIVWKLRLARGLEAGLVGALLGGVGVTFQAYFRNPLAEPYIVGTSSGAAVGSAIILVSGLSAGALGVLAMPIAAFAGGLGTLLLVLALSRKRGVTDPQRLLLAGVVLSTLLYSVLSLILLASGESTTRVLQFLLGHFGNARWENVILLAPTLVLGYIGLFRLSKSLNAMMVSSETAITLGVDPGRLRWSVLIWGTILTSICVGTAGVIGFVGLVAPHIARRIVGPDVRRSLFASMAIGMILILLADAIAQRGVRGVEFPVGVVTALFGAPTLLYLLRREANA